MRKLNLEKLSYLPKVIQLLSQGKDADTGLSSSKKLGILTIVPHCLRKRTWYGAPPFK